jgi:small-conductance mechanosensitive channel
MIEIIISALTELLEIQKDYNSGNAEEQFLLESKKRFANSLNEFIDYRVGVVLDKRRSAISQDRLSLADSINVAVQSTASTIKTLSALQSAPPPIKDGNDEELKIWVEEYNNWYVNNRKKGMTIG